MKGDIDNLLLVFDIQHLDEHGGRRDFMQRRLPLYCCFIIFLGQLEANIRFGHACKMSRHCANYLE